MQAEATISTVYVVLHEPDGTHGKLQLRCRDIPSISTDAQCAAKLFEQDDMSIIASVANTLRVLPETKNSGKILRVVPLRVIGGGKC